MSVSINQIIFQYLQFASEQQRGLANIASEISEINSRVSDIINLYTNVDRLETNSATNTATNPATNLATNTATNTATNSATNPETSPETRPTSNANIDDNVENIRNIILPNRTDEQTDVNELTENDANNANETDSFPLQSRDIFSSQRRSSIIIPRMTEPARSIHRESPISSLLNNIPSISPPPPPPPTIPPPLEIPTIRSVLRNDRQSPILNSRYSSSTYITSIPYRHRSFTFSNTPIRRTIVENPLADLSPVRIRPSMTQIRRGTALLTWNDISNNYQTSCPIDLVSFDEESSVLRIIECKHIFREMNLRRHFRNSPNCPICRYDIRDYIPDYNQSSLTSEAEDIISDNIANLVDNAVTNINRTNRRNRSSISLT
jgi:hypothetical protein